LCRVSLLAASGVFWGEASLKPHRSRYWLNAKPADPAQFTRQVKTICDLYAQALLIQSQGKHLISSDEMTGIQALERLHPALPMQPGRAERIEFEYTRHGTQSLIASFEVASGRVLVASLGPRRTEEDFAVHLAQVIAADPQGEWIFVLDQLNTHKSATLVEWIAHGLQLEDDLGIKGECGILQSMSSRAAFLSEPGHRIRFVYTPTHASWLNQIEIWFSILVRRVLRRGSFTSVQELKQRILAYVA
jgi:hypothetical protein